MIIENRLTFFFLLLLTFISSIGVYWIHRLSMQQEKNYGHYPSSIGLHLIANRYDVNGGLINILTAQDAYQYSDTDTTEFHTVHLQAYGKPTEPPWNIQASKAIAYGTGEKVALVGEVQMQRVAFLNHLESHLLTANVTIYPDKKFMETHENFSAWQPGTQVNSVGANYDYGQQVLHLISGVQVQYQSKKT